MNTNAVTSTTTQNDGARNDGTLNRMYRTRIGDPETDDEVRGYWLFVLGLLFGIAGVLLFLTSVPQGGIRQLSIVAVGVGFVLVVGPIVRLPLESLATTLVYAGAAVAAVGIAYFVVVFPDGWSIRNGSHQRLRLGLLLIDAGGVVGRPSVFSGQRRQYSGVRQTSSGRISRRPAHISTTMNSFELSGNER